MGCESSKQSLTTKSQTGKRIFLIGGTGRTGLLVAEGALAEGHSVTAIVRRAPKTAGTLQVSAEITGAGSSQEIYGEKKISEAKEQAHQIVVGPHERLNVIVASFTPQELTPLMKDHDVVIAIVGGWPKPNEPIMTTYSDPAKAYIPAMKANKITRIFTVFGAGFLGPTIPQEWQDTGNAEGDAINKVRRDMRRVWDLVNESKLDYTIWCPANFPSGPRSEKYTIGKNVFVGPEVTTGMVADSMLKELNEDKLRGVRIGIAASK